MKHRGGTICRPGAAARKLAGLLCLLPGLAVDPARADCASGAVLVPAGSVWKYLDTGTNLPLIWQSPPFNDSAWASGPARLGYGDGDESIVTTVSYGPNPDNKYVTTYFRTAFVVTNASAFNQLAVSVVRDDGVVVYLNGAEIFRNNMPPGPINYLTFASTNVYGGGENTFYSGNASAGLVLNGTNVLAAEVHQAGADSIDLIFDLQLAASNVVVLTRGPYLQQGTPSSMIVRWRTSSPTDSRVRYGVDPDHLSSAAADATPTTEHQVKLAGLTPDSRYYYSVGYSADAADCALTGDPQAFYFYTSPAGARPTRIWAIGDAGTATVSQLAVRDAYYNFAAGLYTDVWLMLGDNAYYSGTDSNYQRDVFDIYPDLLRTTPVWPTIGNHDTYSTTDFNKFPYLNIFSLPTQGEAGGVASGTEKYYSFNFGNIHFVCLDSMTSDRSGNGAMLTWLRADLAANTNDWLIPFWHHPPYSKGSHDSDDNFFNPELVQMRENAVPILEAYGADLVLCGHSHSYERSYLINGHYGYSYTLAPSMLKDPGDGRVDGTGPYTKPSLGPAPNQGTVYTVAGSSGQISGGTLDHPAMFVSLNELGSVVLDINSNRLDALFLRETGEIDDHYSLIKGVPDHVFRITAVQNVADVLTVTWNSQPGQFYWVERATDLGLRDWNIMSGTIQATDTSTSWSDFIGTGLPTGFYRVLRVP